MARSSSRSAAPSDSSGASPAEPKRRFGRRRTKVKDPKNPGRIAQFKQVFAMTRRNDPSVVWWMALAFVLVMLVGALVGLWLDMLIYVLVITIPIALVAVMFVLARRAEKAAYKQIEGQPGASGAVLGSLRRGWFYDQEPVAAEAGGKVRGMRDIANAAMVFRAVGRPGVVLLAEGPKGAALRLAASEKRKVARVVGDGVPVHVLRIGTGEDTTPVSKLTKTMQKMDKTITKEEAIVVHQRLKALGGPKAPVPAGMDPRRARVDRRALRGR